jgi:hypothetical protein
MIGQTEIPGDFGERTSGPCRWCGAEPTEPFEVEPPRYGLHRKNGVRVMKKRPIMVPACRECRRRLERAAA